ncbi:MAG TPA: thioesterase family protein [Steroidobacteraceae bacterium]|nr:thioesterase family protein [Steroidobacteraceae bacterium]
MQSGPETPMADFDFPNPHLIELSVLPEDIDEYRHVNNSVYLRWLDRVAWSHSAALGLTMEECIGMRRGMAAVRTEIDYLLAALRGDRVWVATWITKTDHRLRVERRFQVRRAAGSATLARARTEYVCINLDNGRAARMPEPFARLYVSTAAP